MNKIDDIIEDALNNRFCYDLNLYLSHIESLIAVYNKDMIQNKDLTIRFYETISEMLDGIRDSFNRDKVPYEIKLKLLSIVLPNWNVSNDLYYKEKLLDDTFLNILGELQLNKTFPNTSFDNLIQPYKPFIDDIDYEIIKRKIWF